MSQQEHRKQNLSNRLHRHTAQSTNMLSSARHTGLHKLTQPGHVKGIWGRARATGHPTDESVDLGVSTRLEIPLSLPQWVLLSRDVTSPLLFLCTSSSPAAPIANAGSICHARRSLRQGHLVCQNCLAHTRCKRATTAAYHLASASEQGS